MKSIIFPIGDLIPGSISEILEFISGNTIEEDIHFFLIHNLAAHCYHAVAIKCLRINRSTLVHTCVDLPFSYLHHNHNFATVILRNAKVI